jgi:hypothetical protein
VVLAVVVLAVAAIAGAQIVSGASGSGNGAADFSAADRAPVHQAPGVDARDPASHAKGAPRRTRATAASPAPVRQLAVPLAQAFGPGGTATGDNPGSAMNAVSPRVAQPWTTHWYATSRFGALKPGTGLLLDMGRTVTVTRVAVELGTGSGVSLQLRAGRAPGVMRTTATAAGVGGAVVLHLSKPVRARYLLVWFTTLPAVGNGQYQVRVYHVTVDGRS